VTIYAWSAIAIIFAECIRYALRTGDYGLRPGILACSRMLPLRIADLSESRETLASSPRASLEKYTRLRTMPSSVVNPVAVRYNVRFLLVELLDKYAVRCTSRRALSHSIAGSRNATLSIMEHAWKGKTRLEIKSTRHLVALLSSSTERCEWRRMRLAR
jgi:hypothetical protein